MGFISQDVLSFDFVTSTGSITSVFTFIDVFNSDLITDESYKFASQYYVRNIDPIYLFNSSYSYNKSLSNKTYEFTSKYGMSKTSSICKYFTSKYIFPNVNNVLNVEFASSYSSYPPVNGAFEFSSRYEYIINDSIFNFSSEYTLETISSISSKASLKYFSVDGYNKIHGAIAILPLHQYGLFDFDTVVERANIDLLDTKTIDISDIALSVNDIGILISNGSSYKDVIVPINLLAITNGIAAIPGTLNRMVKVDFKKIRINTSSISDKFNIDIMMPHIVVKMIDIDPYRPVTVKLIKIKSSIINTTNQFNASVET
jgi:hypothetical protein